MAIEYLKYFPHGKIIIPQTYFSSHQYFSNFGALAVLAGLDVNSFVLAKQNDIFEIDNLITCDYLYFKGIFHPKAIENLNPLIGHNPRITKNIFIERPSKYSRTISNMPEIERINQKKNQIDQITLGGSDLQTQRKVWAESSLLIGVIGSDFTNILFGNSGRIFSLTPNWFNDNFFFGLAAAKGYEWNELFCNKLVEKKAPIHKSSFHVESESYKKIIESLV